MMEKFDFNAEAELYPSRAKNSRRRPVGYKRFERAADAIRFAMEELPTEALAGAYLEIGEERYNSHQMQQLYERPDYPLERHKRVILQQPEAAQSSGRLSAFPRRSSFQWAK
jgi:hypothetical protein